MTENKILIRTNEDLKNIPAQYSGNVEICAPTPNDEITINDEYLCTFIVNKGYVTVTKENKFLAYGDSYIKSVAGGNFIMNDSSMLNVSGNCIVTAYDRSFVEQNDKDESISCFIFNDSSIGKIYSGDVTCNDESVVEIYTRGHNSITTFNKSFITVISDNNDMSIYSFNESTVCIKSDAKCQITASDSVEIYTHKSYSNPNISLLGNSRILANSILI